MEEDGDSKRKNRVMEAKEKNNEKKKSGAENRKRKLKYIKKCVRK